MHKILYETMPLNTENVHVSTEKWTIALHLPHQIFLCRNYLLFSRQLLLMNLEVVMFLSDYRACLLLWLKVKSRLSLLVTCTCISVPNPYLLLRLVVSVCPCVRPCVRSCVRVKNGNGSRMRALPDELSPVTSEVHGHRSKYHVSVY